jgi:hypothetical protein
MSCAHRPPTLQGLALRAARVQARALHDPWAAAGAQARGCRAGRPPKLQPCVSARPGAVTVGGFALVGAAAALRRWQAAAACRLDDSVPRSKGAQGGASGVQRALSERRARAQGGCRDRRRNGARWRSDADKRAGRAHGATALAAHAAHAAHARHARGLRAQAQAHDKQEEGKRDKARGTALAASSSVSEEFPVGGSKVGSGRRKDGRQSSCA